MNMPVGIQEKYKQIARCDQAMEIRLKWRDMEFYHRSGEMEFALYGREGDELVEGLTQFKYLGLTEG